MAALTENVLITVRDPGKRRAYTVAAGKTIYQGAQVFVDATSGLATDDGNSGANQFVGICEEGGGAGETIEVYAEGCFKLPITSVAAGSVGDPIFSDDSNGATTSATNARYIGTCTEYVSSGIGWVEIDTQNRAQVDAVT